MKKYVFDIKSGHYKLYEADDNNTSGDGQSQEQNNNTSTQAQNTQKVDKNSSVTAGKLDSDEIYQKLVAAKNDLERVFKQTTAPIEIQLNKEMADAAAKGVDPKLSSKVIGFENAIFKYKSDFMNKSTAIEKQMLARREQLKIESLGMPDRYQKMLYEGNIETYKVYLNDLFNDFDTFHKVFEKSDLIYGEDNDNVFVLIESYEDVIKARELLYYHGFYEHFVDMAFQPLLEKQTPEWFL